MCSGPRAITSRFPVDGETIHLKTGDRARSPLEGASSAVVASPFPDLFGSPSEFAEVADAERVVAFGEADARFIADEIAVVVVGGGEFECAKEKKLAGGGFEQIGSANDFGDLHGGIVDHDGELVGGDVVATPNDEISEIASCGQALGGEMQVGE